MKKQYSVLVQARFDIWADSESGAEENALDQVGELDACDFCTQAKEKPIKTAADAIEFLSRNGKTVVRKQARFNTPGSKQYEFDGKTFDAATLIHLATSYEKLHELAQQIVETDEAEAV